MSQAPSVSRAAGLLVAGRAVGFVAAFAIPVVLARVFAPTEFGTYKMLFLVFSTFYGIAQIGMAESLYYFVPGRSSEAGRHVANAIVALAVAGVASIAVLRWVRMGPLANPAIADYLVLLGVLLAFMLVTTVLEIVMITRKQNLRAAITFAASDLARALLFVVPAIGFRSIRGVLMGAVVFSALRVVAMMVYLWREFGRELRIDYSLLRRQLAYALPFALAVGIEVVQLNLHQYIVASRFDAVTFAIYAVGCLQIPIVDLIMTSTCNVMMVGMAEQAAEGDRVGALALWHGTTRKLALIFFPMTALLLVTASQVIVTLFTTKYVASVPIFMVWTLMILPTAFAVDGVLRVYAQTRFLLVMNIARLAFVVGLVGWCLSTFGLTGAVLVTLLATVFVKGLAVVRIARVFEVRVRDVLPWGGLTGIAVRSAIASAPAYWVTRALPYPPLAVAMCAGVVYSLTYAALVYGSLGWAGLEEMLPWSSRQSLGAAGASPADRGAAGLGYDTSVEIIT